MLNRIGWNFIVQLIGLMLSFLDRFLIVGLLLRVWGAEKFADWAILLSCAGMIASTELGLNIYYGNTWQRLNVNGDTASFNRLLSIALGIAACLGCALCIIATTIPLLFNLKFSLSISSLSSTHALACYFLLTATAISRVLRGSISQIYRGRGLYAAGAMIDLVAQFSAIVITLVAAAAGAQPLAIAMAYLASDLICGWMLTIYDQRRRFPELVYRPALPTRDELRDMQQQVRWFAVLQGAPVIWLQAPVLLLGYLSVGKEIVTFILVRTLVNFARQFGVMMSLSASLELVGAVNGGQHEDVQRQLLVVGPLLSVVTAATAVAVLAFGAHFTQLWTGGSVPFNANVAALLLVSAVVTSPSAIITSLIMLGQTPVVAGQAQLLQLSAGLFACAAFASLYGIAGAAAGLAIGEILAFGFLMLRSTRLFRLNTATYLAKCATAAFLTAMWCAAVAVLVRTVVPGGAVSHLLSSILAWGLFGFLPAVLLSLNRSQRSGIAAWLRRAIRI
jgi:hypothetical protein